ncbi:MAG: hypothetical protein LQ340_001535 [Diploschistes diacapsis]|nr:MAG: hypothetical protein LQ340_001535 [Diploschistes diacapsis]
MQSDADAFARPREFRGFRTADAGASEKRGRWSSASSVGERYLPFGYGTHACPGRFLAVRMIKMVFATLILDYDVEFDAAARLKARPARTVVEGQFVPDMRQGVRLRRRRRSRRR